MKFIFHLPPQLPVPLENIYLYDAVKVLALALNKTINNNKEVTDGIEVVKNMRELRYRSKFAHKLFIT